MKKWIVFSFHTLGTILAVVLIVGNLFFREHTDYLRIITSAIFIVTYFISLKYYFPKQNCRMQFLKRNIRVRLTVLSVMIKKNIKNSSRQPVFTDWENIKKYWRFYPNSKEFVIPRMIFLRSIFYGSLLP